LGYLVAFGLVLFGYTLLDWGHYIRKHENVSVWYLISGMGEKYNAGGSKTSASSGASGLGTGPAAVAGGNQPSPGGGSW
jgi:hypothetical protein